MRGRSKSVLCNTVEQLQSLQTTPPSTPPSSLTEAVENSHELESVKKMKHFDSIDEYLQKLSSECGMSQSSDYYFNCEDQLQDDQDLELNKNAFSDFIPLSIVILCEQVQPIVALLTEKTQLSSASILSNFKPPENNHPSTLKFTNPDSNSSQNFNSPNQFKTNCISFRQDHKQERNTCKQIYSEKEPFESLAKETDLIIIYKFSEQQELIDKPIKYSFEKQKDKESHKFQHKIWIFKKKHEYKKIIGSYIKLADFVYETVKEDNGMEVKENEEYIDIKLVELNIDIKLVELNQTEDKKIHTQQIKLVNLYRVVQSKTIKQQNQRALL